LKLRNINFSIVGYSFYEISLALLVILTLVISFPPPLESVLEWSVWTIFILDYLYRLLKSENKWRFIWSHPLDLIAILPMGVLFQSARLVRLVRLVRLLSLFNRKTLFLDHIFQKYKVDKILISVLVILFLVALSMRWLEPKTFHSYGDALWWAMVTTTTVGYGDIYPTTSLGRMIASILMVTGIGVIGIITGTVASFFTRANEQNWPQELEDVHNKMLQYPNLDEIDYQYMIDKLEKIRNQ
jgi:voltage-gated potassium channel